MRKILSGVLLFLALGALMSAAAQREDIVEKRFKKADALIEKGDYAKAREELDAVRDGLKADDARQVRCHERLGAAWLREGKIEKAREAFTAAIKAAQRLKAADDSGARAYAGMGLCLRRENKDAYALRFFRKALTFRLDEGTKMFAEDQIREIEGAPPLPAP